MIYFDNAATTKYKPEEVYQAFEYYIREIGVSPGRGSYQLGIEASRMLFKVRKVVGEYFGLEKKSNVVFTKNSTEAINLFFNGMLCKGDHVVITCYEHNAVLRPLQHLQDMGLISYSIINRNDLLLPTEEIYNKYCLENTKIFAMTLASNLTGRIVYDKKLMLYIQQKGIITFLDASQGAGKVRINMKEDGIDYLAFTGHKDLLALTGVGGLCCKEKNIIKPLIQGGTGIWGDSYTNPDVFPEGLEAGTLNMPAIWSLKTSLEYIENHYTEIQEKDRILTSYLMDSLSKMKTIEIYDSECKRVGVVGFNIHNYQSNKVVELLDENEICVRGGIHCAILAHEALGTKEIGVIRVSLSYLNSIDEIDQMINILEKSG